MKQIVKWSVALIAVPGLAGFLVQIPAHADDWRDRREIRSDIIDIRRDERRLSDLEWRRDEARRCRDWRAVRRLDREIGDLRRHIERDRRELRRDIDRSRDRRHDRDYYRRW